MSQAKLLKVSSIFLFPIKSNETLIYVLVFINKSKILEFLILRNRFLKFFID